MYEVKHISALHCTGVIKVSNIWSNVSLSSGFFSTLIRLKENCYFWHPQLMITNRLFFWFTKYVSPPLQYNYAMLICYLFQLWHCQSSLPGEKSHHWCKRIQFSSINTERTIITQNRTTSGQKSSKIIGRH